MKPTRQFDVQMIVVDEIDQSKNDVVGSNCRQPAKYQPLPITEQGRIDRLGIHEPLLLLQNGVVLGKI